MPFGFIPDSAFSFAGIPTMIGEGRFVLENGILRTESGPGLLFYSFPQSPGAGHLHVEFKLTRSSDEAAVLIRMEEPSASTVGVVSGYKVRIGAGGTKHFSACHKP